MTCRLFGLSLRGFHPSFPLFSVSCRHFFADSGGGHPLFHRRSTEVPTVRRILPCNFSRGRVGEAMRTLRVSPFLLCLLGCIAVRGLAQEKPDAAAIRALESKWVDAYKQRQIATVASLLADDYVITVEDGST